VLPPHKHSAKLNYKLYSDIVAERDEKKFTLTHRTKGNHTPEGIIRVLKEKVNPVEIKVGITSLKTLRNGRVLIEAGRKTEINLMGDNIRKECTQTLVVNMQTLRKPRMIILNTPTEITLENILEILTQQSSELATVGENIVPKYC
jgi:hypothetical protein